MGHARATVASPAPDGSTSAICAHFSWDSLVSSCTTTWLVSSTCLCSPVGSWWPPGTRRRRRRRRAPSPPPPRPAGPRPAGTAPGRRAGRGSAAARAQGPGSQVGMCALWLGPARPALCVGSALPVRADPAYLGVAIHAGRPPRQPLHARPGVDLCGVGHQEIAQLGLLGHDAAVGAGLQVGQLHRQCPG